MTNLFHRNDATWSQVSSGDLATRASLQASAANPSGITSTTNAMLGLGSTFNITPSSSGRIAGAISGFIQNNTAGAGVTLILWYGTGTPPVHGASTTGTSGAGTAVTGVGGAGFDVPFCLPFVINATVGVAEWIDMSMAVSAGSTGIVGNNVIAVYEL